MSSSSPVEPDDRRPAPAIRYEQRREISTPVESPGYERFYRESVPRLVAFLRWQGAPLPDARDCVQETMLAAFQQWSTLRQPYAWCRLVASRQYARRVAAIHEDPAGEIEPSGIALGADALLDIVEQRHAVLRLLDQLPMRQRQVMAWTYDGAAPAEIAIALKLSAEAVRSNLYKARAALRRRLQDGV
jgi:RNA polymerase sigma factor (sigma-70 family)